jgi:hypothetical protein
MPRGRSRGRRLGLAALTLLGLVALGGPARAEVRRFALLVGANNGTAGDAPLRYAESDVDSVARTLSQVAGFTSERVVRLTAPTAARVRGALVDLSLAIQEQVRAGHEAVLFVYYSGHSDAQNLHLGGTELATEELSKLVRLSPARLKVLLLDSCRSGALTRVKGGHQVPPFQIRVDDQLRFEGYAVITSSSAGEDAQESDALKSSIFTHHFLAALRGPADVNHDGLVTLGEAYAYAYEQALKSSMVTVVGSQHATYDYDLRGRADPVLADLRSVADQARLLLPTPGEYLVMSADAASVVLEAITKTKNTQVMLPPARYQVRLRTRTNVYQGEVTLSTGEATALDADSMKPVPLAQVIRKGETEARLAQGPSVAGSMHGPIGDGFSPMLGVQAAWAFELPRLTLMPRLGLAAGRVLVPPAGISHDLAELTAELTALYVFDFERFSVAPLVSVGSSFLRQRITRNSCRDSSCRTEAHPIALLTTVGAWLLAPLGRGFALEGTLELVNFYARRQPSNEDLELNPQRLGALTYRVGLGVGYRY